MAVSSPVTLTARRLLPGPPIDPDAPVVVPLAATTALFAAGAASLLALLLVAAVALTGPGALIVAVVAAVSGSRGAQLARRGKAHRDIVPLPAGARVLTASEAARGQLGRLALGFLAYGWTPFVAHGLSRTLALCFGAYMLGRPLGSGAAALAIVRTSQREQRTRYYVVPRRDAAVLYGRSQGDG